MPLIESRYRPPRGFSNPHLQTLYGGMLRPVVGPRFERERLELPDGDFVDLDWLCRGHRRLAVVSHGLEGHGRRVYMRGMARALSRCGWDVLCWSYRGCSGTPNRLLRAYHSGATEDLHAVVERGLEDGYRVLSLVGFSLGGNLVLKYLGEAERDPRIARAAVFSVPVDLEAGCRHVDRLYPRLYLRRFLDSLTEKARLKHARFPGQVPSAVLDGVDSLFEFDDLFTAPVHGFENAVDYYARCSAQRFFPGLDRPVLLVQARDDPFLPTAAYPIDAARAHPHLHLEVPPHGGHVAFVAWGREYWSERRAAEWLDARR